MINRVFFPQAALDEWLSEDRIDLNQDVLHLKGPGRRYRMIEAVRILREVTGSDDPHELLGRVKTRAFLNELGAELLENSMIIGDNAYDVVQGFVGAPIAAFNDYKRSSPPSSTPEAANEAVLLTAFLGSTGG